MTLRSDAMMVLFYDIEGDTADHDDWHSYEHFHERLSVPGFLRATRWIATEASPRYLVTYEVSDVDVATSQAYLDRLNNPSEWTRAMMPRFRGMIRGFCSVSASTGFGLGAAAVGIRFLPEAGKEAELVTWLSTEVLPSMMEARGVVGAHLLQPAPPPPMTQEQALRGADLPMPWLILVTGYDRDALDAAVAEHLTDADLQKMGGTDLEMGRYAFHYTADSDEVARTATLPVLTAPGRK
ncbi:hypothetical protein PXK00_15475 [Phaeobacter sp. QD34_3]|uniref:hypothetical protein n=1 Tax=unclassified Phaeobacter TaxID=2621772 RepID=UPI00237F9EA9|nr:MULTISPECIES: hypothetical protein [unclassified Phaeobacter]MDE4134519.1 hypothetical protein [Phaeobacter sp. QD34_3]MDE4138178.1 hypothetical protein [Phaeobacter sp. QD34_24]